MTSKLPSLIPTTGQLKPLRTIEAAARVGKCVATYRRVFVETPVHADFAYKLEVLRQLGIHTSREQHSILQCGAPSSAGKSSVARRFADGLNGVAPKKKVPIVYLEVKNCRTSKDVLKAILRILGDPLSERGTIDEMHLRMSNIARRVGVQMIIIDEIHHLASYSQSDSINMIKGIVNSGLCPVVIIGEEVKSRPFFNTSSEILSRTFLCGDLQPFSRNDEGLCDMAQFLIKIDKELLANGIFRINSDFLNDYALCNLFTASKGIPGGASRIISIALAAAIGRGAEKIELIDLAAGVDDWAMKANKLNINPFYEGRSHA